MTSIPTVEHLKQQLLTLRDRENRFDTVQKCRKQQSTPVQTHTHCATTLTITSEHKDLATQWMYEVVIDSKIRSEIFLHSVAIFDYFLELCLVEIQQVQLCASACLRLASKVRNDELEENKIIDYTDNSITKSELKAWEMLVLSKLNWDVNLVIALDYLEPVLQSLWPQAETTTTSSDSNELKECSVLCCRASQSATFRSHFSPKTVALSVWHKPISKEILAWLEVSQENIDQCTKALFPLTPTVSPFKVESSSTPKSSRLPLRDNIEVINIRRRLTSLNTSYNITAEDNKENNDSAIGGILNTTCSSSGASPTGSSKGSSKGSSTQSSPDSGAACKSPDIAELDKQLESTQII